MSRRVIGMEHVSAAQQAGRNYIELLPGDIVTDLAQETAQSLSIQLLQGPLKKIVPERTDSASALRRQLWRRSPKWMPTQTRRAQQGTSLSKLALVGVGGVGAGIAHLSALSEITQTLTLIDIAPGVAAATALDLQHSAGITQSRTHVEGGDQLELVAGADVVVVSAGKARTPGMTRDDLSTLNKRVIMASAEAIANLAPNAVVIVVTNPLDEMTLAMLHATAFPRERILGMAGTLDSSRFRVSLAKAAGVDARDVEALTLGSHGQEMVPISSLARIKGAPLHKYLNEETLAACVDRAVNGGSDVVALRRTGSATLAPAHSVIEVLEHLTGKRRGWVPVSVLLQGEYGMSDVVMGVPAHLDAQGLLRIEELPISDLEHQQLKQACLASTIRQAAIVA